MPHIKQKVLKGKCRSVLNPRLVYWWTVVTGGLAQDIKDCTSIESRNLSNGLDSDRMSANK